MKNKKNRAKFLAWALAVVFAFSCLPFAGRINVEAASNLIVNGDFSNGTEGWLDAMLVPNGYNHGGVVKNAGSTTFNATTNDARQNLALEHGKTYVLSGWFKSSGTGGADILIAGMGSHADLYGTSRTIHSTNWTFVEVEFTVTGATDVRFIVWSDEAPGGFLFTDIRLVEKGGQTPPPEPSRDNLIKNGDFSDGTNFWSDSTLFVPNGFSHNGIIQNAGSTSWYPANWMHNSYQNIELEPGKTYQLSGWFKATREVTDVFIAEQTANAVLFGAEIKVSNREWQHMSVVFSVPASDHRQFRLLMWSDEDDGNFLFTGVILTEYDPGPTPTPLPKPAPSPFAPPLYDKKVLSVNESNDAANPFDGAPSLSIHGGGSFSRNQIEEALIPGGIYKAYIWAKGAAGSSIGFGIVIEGTDEEAFPSEDRSRMQNIGLTEEWERYEISFTMPGHWFTGRLEINNPDGNAVNVAQIEIWMPGTNGARPASDIPEGWFEIIDGRIYDPNGFDFVPIGTNAPGPGGFFSRDILQDVDLLTDVWNFNVIRLVCSFGYLWQTFANTDEEAIVKAFTDKGVVVMFEMHEYSGYFPDEHAHWSGPSLGGLPGNTVRYPLSVFAQKWAELAQRYKDNPYVWFNIMNEPGDGGWPHQLSSDTWDYAHRAVIDAIREVAPYNIIVLDEQNYGVGFYPWTNPPLSKDGPGSAILNKGPALNADYPNLLYSLHPYPWHEQAVLQSFIDHCREANLALVIGEFATTLNNQGLNTHVAAVYNVCVPAGVGRIYWAWSDDQYAVTVNGGGGYTINRRDGSKPTNLTWFGELVWDDAHGALTLPVYAPGTGPTPTPVPGEPQTGNLITNGDFSDGTAGWLDAMLVANGFSHGGEVKNAGSTTYNNGTNDAKQNLTLLHGKTYVLSGWFKSSGSGGADVQISGMGSHSPLYGTSRTVGSTDWTFVEIEFTVTGATDVRFMVWSDDPPGGFLFTDISLVEKGGEAPTPTPVIPDPTPTPPPQTGNLLENGDFATDESGWFGVERVVNGFDRDGVVKNAGRIAHGNIFQGKGTSHTFIIENGKTYVLSFWCKADNSSGTDVYIQYQSGGHHSVWYVHNTAWEFMSFEFTGDGKEVEVFFWTDTPNFWIADVTVAEKVALPTPTPTPILPDPTPTPQPQTGNLIVNGDFSDGTNGWLDIMYIADGFNHGGVIKNAGSTTMNVYANDAKQLINLEAGKTYVLSGWFKSSGNGGADVLIASAGSHGTLFGSSRTISGTSWIFHELEFTVPADGPTEARFMVWADDPPGGFLFTDISLVEKAAEIIPKDPGIYILSLPNKLSYFIGDSFDITGLRFTYSDENGSTSNVTATTAMLDLSGFDSSVHGVKTITLNYGDFNLSFAVRVNNNAKFTVDGHTIYDPNGEVFIPKGTNINGPNMWWSRDTLQDVELICDVWGMNFVRLVTTFGMLWNTAPNRDMDAIVKAFTDKGVVVMIEMHDYTGTYPFNNDQVNNIGNHWRYSLDNFTRMLVELAVRYKDNPYVWINIMNEPSGDSELNVGHPTYTYGDNRSDVETWVRVHDHIIGALRGAGFDNIIVMDENNYGVGRYNPGDPDGHGSAVLYGGPKLNEKYDNLAYSLHPYGWRDYSVLEQYVIHCYERDLALMFGEYGAVWGSPMTHKATKIAFEVFNEYNVGRVYWAWDGASGFAVTDINKGFDGGGYQIDRTDGTKPTNLTWFGGILWDDFHNILTFPLPNYSFPLVANSDFSDGLSGWHNYQGQLQYLNSGSHDGSAHARMIPGANYTGQDLDADFAIAGGEYRFSAWARHASPGSTQFGIAFTEYPGGPEMSYVLFFDESVWTYKELYLTLPENLHSLRLFIWQPDGNTDVYFDDVCFDYIEPEGEIFTVAFNVNGNGTVPAAIASATVTEGSSVVLPSIDKEGFMFGGWYTAESDGIKAGNAGDLYYPEQDITLFARWPDRVQNDFIVKFDTMGGSGSFEKIYGFTGDLIVLPSTSMANHVFIGWYTAADGGAFAGMPNGRYGPNADITLYARWEKLPPFTLFIGEEKPGGAGFRREITVSGYGLSEAGLAGKILVVELIEGIGNNTRTTVVDFDAAVSVRISYQRSDTIVRVWLMDDTDDFVMPDAGGVYYAYATAGTGVEIPPIGCSPTPTPAAVLVNAVPSAYVTKINGSQNDLTVTVIEKFSDGTRNIISNTIRISNNAAGTYSVGAYRVYVDTKGNDQIREIYLIK